ncbi:hypothetical protein ASS77_00120 [Staphylococcus saprophyticus]|nr:hypothetical protein ASS77_00120 [Staphylococcus saprophyticus]
MNYYLMIVSLYKSPQDLKIPNLILYVELERESKIALALILAPQACRYKVIMDSKNLYHAYFLMILAIKRLR